MPETPTRQEMLTLIHSEHQLLEERLASLTEEQYFIPGVEPGWTVKDLLAHFAAWEQRMIDWIGLAMAGEVPDVPMTDQAVNALNAATWERDEDLSLEEARRRFHATHPEALHVAETTPNEVLFDPDHFPWRNGRPLWYMVAANTYWHYQQHRESLEKWLSTQED